MYVQFSESVVKANPNKSQIFMRDLWVALLASSVLLSFFINIFFIVLVPVFGFLLYRSLVTTTAEYEYTHTNDDFDVDRVVFNSKRKNLVSLHASQIVCIAPDRSPSIGNYLCSSVKDYSANADGKNRYAMVYSANGNIHKLILNLDQKMIKSLRLTMPTKVEIYR